MLCVSSYVVYANGNRAYEARNKASVTRVARAWERLGYEPKMYAHASSSTHTPPRSPWGGSAADHGIEIEPTED